jgi:hypothetical protein
MILPLGASPQVLAQPSKQQRPFWGQSVSRWPGDQQVDTLPAHIDMTPVIRVKLSTHIDQQSGHRDQQVDMLPARIEQHACYRYQLVDT